MDRSKNRVSKEKKEFLQEGWSMASLCRSYKSSKKRLSTKIKYQLFLLLRRRSSFLDAYLILIFYFLARQDLRFTSHQLQQHIVHFLAPIFGSVSFIKCLFLKLIYFLSQIRTPLIPNRGTTNFYTDKNTIRPRLL